MSEPMIDLVFLPGLLSDDQVWRHQINALKQSYSVQVIPLTEFSSPQKMVEHVLKVAPKEFVLFGHSLGGWVALEVAKSAPERIKGLGLLNTTARPESQENKVWHELLIKKANEESFESVISNLLPIYLTPIDLGDPKLHDELLNMFLRMGKETFIRQQTAIINRPGNLNDLAHIKCPTLIIHASNDVLVSSEMQEEMLNKIPNSNIEIIRECGHFSMLEKPEDVTKMTKQWLDEKFLAKKLQEQSQHLE